jgi:hypothetical protein
MKLFLESGQPGAGDRRFAGCESLTLVPERDDTAMEGYMTT